MTTTRIRPNSTDIVQSLPGGFIVGAATIQAAWSDDNDASYVQVGSSNTNIVVGFGTFALPAGAVITTVTNGYRASIQAGGVSSAGVRRYQAVGTSSVPVTPNVTQNYTNNYVTTAAGPPTTQADIDAYQVQVYISTIPAYPVLFYEVWTGRHLRPASVRCCHSTDRHDRHHVAHRRLDPHARHRRSDRPDQVPGPCVLGCAVRRWWLRPSDEHADVRLRRGGQFRPFGRCRSCAADTADVPGLRLDGTDDERRGPVERLGLHPVHRGRDPAEDLHGGGHAVQLDRHHLGCRHP